MKKRAAVVTVVTVAVDVTVAADATAAAVVTAAAVAVTVVTTEQPPQRAIVRAMA